jgi:hypothetical protein
MIIYLLSLLIRVYGTLFPSQNKSSQCVTVADDGEDKDGSDWVTDIQITVSLVNNKKKTPWSESVSELYRLFFSGSAGNRTRASGSVAKNSDH